MLNATKIRPSCFFSLVLHKRSAQFVTQRFKTIPPAEAIALFLPEVDFLTLQTNASTFNKHYLRIMRNKSQGM